MGGTRLGARGLDGWHAARSWGPRGLRGSGNGVWKGGGTRLRNWESNSAGPHSPEPEILAVL